LIDGAGLFIEGSSFKAEGNQFPLEIFPIAFSINNGMEIILYMKSSSDVSEVGLKY
jgi:hypothetical protein